MKKMNRTFSVITLLVLLFAGLVSCSSGGFVDDEVHVAVTSAIIVTGHKSNAIDIDSTETLEAILVGDESMAIEWKTSDTDGDITIEADPSNAKKCVVTAKGETASTVSVWAQNSDGSIKSNIIKYSVGAVPEDGDVWISDSTTVSLGSDLSVNTGASVTLEAKLNEVLTEDVTYKWFVDDAEISGATLKTYTLTAADGDKTYKVVVTGGRSNKSVSATVKVTGSTQPSVAAGTYNLTTKSDYGTVLFSKQNNGSSQTNENITVTAKIDTKGANIYLKSKYDGGIFFRLDKQMTVSFAYDTDNGVDIFKIDADGESATAESSLTLAAGSYVVRGQKTSATKVKTITFAE